MFGGRLGDVVEMDALGDNVGHERKQPPVGCQADLRPARAFRAQTADNLVSKFHRHTNERHFFGSSIGAFPFERWLCRNVRHHHGLAGANHVINQGAITLEVVFLR